MKYLLSALYSFSISLASCQVEPSNYLIKIYEGEFDEIGVRSGYVNQTGDTIIPLGKFYYCYTDTLKNFAIVLDHNGICLAIDKNEKIVFQVQWYDNGPDPISDGLFRIIIDGKTGYSNENGEIVIEPKFDCTNPFVNGKAKVAYTCELIADGEHTRMKSNEWFYINKKGNRIE